MISIRSCAGILVGATFLLGACTKPGITEPTPGQPSGVQNDSRPEVGRPWHEGVRQLGVNLYWEDSKEDDDEVTRAKSRRIIDYLIPLNVNSIAINFPFAMDGSTGSSVRPDEKYTPSPQRLAIFLEEAASAKMRVSVRPLLDERSLITTWRGKIAPTNVDSWFASYSDFLLPYAAIAARHGTADFVIGVELNSLQTDPRWTTLIAALRQTFPGRLTYSANFDVFQEKLATPAVDAVGVDAYFKVDAPDDATVEALAAAWDSWISKYASGRASKLILHEVGIAAQNGAHGNPGHWGNAKAPLNLDLQKNWYEAVCQAVEHQDLAGLYFWNIRMHHEPGHEDPNQDDRLTFVDRPAQDAIRDCYQRLGDRR